MHHALAARPARLELRYAGDERVQLGRALEPRRLEHARDRSARGPRAGEHDLAARARALRAHALAQGAGSRFAHTAFASRRK